MQHEKEILCRYRLERAKEDLEAARVNHSSGLFKAAINRSYYAIFHSIRAVNILDGFDASKHSSVIAHFNQYYVHTGEFDRGIYKIMMAHIGSERNATIVISSWPQKKNLLSRSSMQKHL